METFKDILETGAEISSNIELVKIIVGIGETIWKRVKFVKTSQKRCERLALRINIITSSLSGLGDIPETDQFREALLRLRECLQEYKKFIEALSKKNLLQKMFGANRYEREFEEFNLSLAQAINDLSLGLNVHQVINSEQDKIDREEDFAKLLEKTEQVYAQQREMYSAQKRDFASIKMRFDEARFGAIQSQHQETKYSTSPETESDFWYKKGIDYEERKEFVTAHKYYTRAIKTCQHPEATYRLGFFHVKGLGGVPKDTIKAHGLFFQAAKKNHTRAQFNLATSFLRGVGVTQDIKEAEFWFRQSAAQNYRRAQHSLAVLLETEQNDLEQAGFWYQKAAEQGYEKAQNRLDKLEVRRTIEESWDFCSREISDCVVAYCK